MVPCHFLPGEKYGKNRAHLNKKSQPVLSNDPEEYSSPGGHYPPDISTPRLISSTNVLPDSLCPIESPRSTVKTAVFATDSTSGGSSETSLAKSDTIATQSPEAACTYSHSAGDRPDDAFGSRTKSPTASDESASMQLHIALFSPPSIPRIGLQRKATIRVAGSAVLKTRTAEHRLAAYNKLSCVSRPHTSSTPSVARSDGSRGEHADGERSMHSHNGENEGYNALYNWDAQTSALARRVARRRMPRTTADTESAQENCRSISKATDLDDSNSRVLCDITNAFGGTSAGAETAHQVPRPLSRPRRHRPRIPEELLQIDATVPQKSKMSSGRWNDNHNGVRPFHG
ncbi:hypothetical protein EDD15DRAFT_1057223 [Pisolithus albus]|nr:hypothetical protein EDD15DRAFT_1057223 [Pisolithus albus]